MERGISNENTRDAEAIAIKRLSWGITIKKEAGGLREVEELEDCAKDIRGKEEEKRKERKKIDGGQDKKKACIADRPG